MSRSSKRTLTATLLVAAGAAVLIALGLAGGNDRASASSPKKGTVEVKINRTEVKNPVKPVTVKAPEKVTPEIKTVVKKEEPPKIDAVFVLDTTGSMGGLIEGAKRKIWAMANQIVSGQPKPDVRIGLVGYRDLGDTYVTRRYALTEDMDDVYAHLSGFRADGGGDTPEHVNRAIADAITKMQWRDGQNVLKLIFLVGDAPPHEGREGLYSHRLAKRAAEKGIIINTVRCGTQEDTAMSWRKIASLTGGMFTSIRQDGAMVAMSTPMDRELADLNRRLSDTAMPTGSDEDKRASSARLRINAAMSVAAQAESAKFRSRSGKLDSKDLLTVLGRGRRLEDMKEGEMPAPVAAMEPAKRKAYVAEVQAKREALQARIDKLAKERDGYLRARTKGAPTAFDDTLGSALKKQGLKIGVAY